ncbi:uncharacterized protein JCM10292_000696 [Rhodotorula paludigena]|uniref:uncharacterized protein n=1 Tax=Rhodotorula paludigena TaxID=86838 RepID=UPI00317C63B1
MEGQLHFRPAPAERSYTDQSLLKSGASTPDDPFEPAKPFAAVPFDGVSKPKAARQATTWHGKAWAWLLQSDSVEAHGVGPLSEEQRTDSNFLGNLTIWTTMNGTISCFSTGTLGPLYYSLSMRDSFLIIVFCNIFSCGVPAYVATFGPRLGMRTMGIARYSYGYYSVILPALLNLISFIGFCAVNSIVAGQVLAAVNPGHLSTTAGIVIVAVISMFVSFCGYRVLHLVERWLWLPIMISFVLLAGFGGRHLGAATSFASDIPATAANVLSFVSIVVGFTISWSGCSADFNTYMRPNVPSYLIFGYTFLGLIIPCILIQMLGAAFGAAALSGLVPTWEAAFADANVGSLVGVALEPLGGFGKFLLVLFSLGMIGNNAPTQYAFSLSMQVVFPFLTRLPRFFLPVVGTAIYLPIALAAAAHFSAALSNFLGLLGYWSSIFVMVLLIEHLLFRRGRFSAYDLSVWDRSSKLPPGIAALLASLCGAAFVVLGMDQVWYRGEFAKSISYPEHHGGDIGFETGMAVAGVVYLPCRWLERHIFGR